MAKNRKTQPTAVRFGPLLLVVLLCGFFSSAGLGYVWHKNRNEQLTRQLRQKRARLDELRAQDKYLEGQWADLRTYRVLEQRVRQLNLGLVMPRPEQILRLVEPPLATAAPPSPIRLASAQSRP